MKAGRVLSAALAAALVAAACSSGDDDAGSQRASGSSSEGGPSEDAEQVTLDVWVNDTGEFGEFHDAVRVAFEEAHPNVKVNTTKFPEDQFEVKVDTAIAADRAPDIITVYGFSRAREGQMLPLDNVIAEKGIDLSTFNPAIVEGPASDFSCWWEGQLYCLGSFLGTALMFYNKDLFDAAGIPHPEPWPPMTLEEYAEVSCQLRDEDADVWGTAFGGNLLPTELLVSPDGHTVDGFIDSPDTIHQYELFTGIVRDGCAPTSNVLDPWTQGADLFARGDLATVITDFASLDKIDEAGIDYGVTAPPTPEGVEPYFFVWTDSVGVLESTDHPQEAKEFLAFIATEGQRIRVEMTGDMPLDTAVADELGWARDSAGRLDALEIVPHARPLVFVPIWPWDPMDDAVNLMMSGEKSVEDALADVAGPVQEEIDEAWDWWDRTG